MYKDKFVTIVSPFRYLCIYLYVMKPNLLVQLWHEGKQGLETWAGRKGHKNKAFEKRNSAEKHFFFWPFFLQFYSLDLFEPV